MTIAQFRRDNHFLPCVYLKGWAAADGKVVTYRMFVPLTKFPVWRRYSPLGARLSLTPIYAKRFRRREGRFETWLDREFETPAEKH
jgi:hypothetical protein